MRLSVADSVGPELTRARGEVAKRASKSEMVPESLAMVLADPEGSPSYEYLMGLQTSVSIFVV